MWTCTSSRMSEIRALEITSPIRSLEITEKAVAERVLKLQIAS
jgi:hypothetical protein